MSNVMQYFLRKVMSNVMQYKNSVMINALQATSSSNSITTVHQQNHFYCRCAKLKQSIFQCKMQI